MKLGFSFRCALLAAAIFISIKLITFLTHTQFSGIGAYSGLISLALLSIPLFIGIKHKRDVDFGGYITLRKAMIAGVAISIMSGIIISVYNYLHYKYIDTEVMSYWIAEAQKLGAAEKKSETEIQQAIDMLKEFYAPFKQATVALTGVLGAGTVLSFILSTFLIKHAPESSN